MKLAEACGAEVTYTNSACSASLIRVLMKGDVHQVVSHDSKGLDYGQI